MGSNKREDGPGCRCSVSGFFISRVLQNRVCQLRVAVLCCKYMYSTSVHTAIRAEYMSIVASNEIVVMASNYPILTLAQRLCDTSSASFRMFCILDAFAQFFSSFHLPLLTNFLFDPLRQAEVGPISVPERRGKAVAWHPGSTIGRNTFPFRQSEMHTLHLTYRDVGYGNSSSSFNRNSHARINLGPTVSPRICPSCWPAKPQIPFLPVQTSSSPTY